MKKEHNKTNDIDIFKALDIAKLYLGKNIVLKVNSRIKHFDRLTKLFERYQIEYTAYTPVVGPPSRFDIHFGKYTDFQDLFIIVAILKNFGLQSVFYSQKNNNEVIVGSYITEYGQKLDISKGISSKTFLEFPFVMTTSELLSQEYGIVDIFETEEESFQDIFMNEDKDELDYNEYDDDDDKQGFYITEWDELDDNEYDDDDSYVDYHRSYSQRELEMGDWDYDPMNPAHDPSENPWIDVFGPGFEAEQAYWNTD
jgi:hypothetical protein